MGWHHRKGDRVRLVYRKVKGEVDFPYRGATGTVPIRPSMKKRGPRNFGVALDSGTVVVVPGGNLRGA